MKIFTVFKELGYVLLSYLSTYYPVLLAAIFYGNLKPQNIVPEQTQSTPVSVYIIQIILTFAVYIAVKNFYSHKRLYASLSILCFTVLLPAFTMVLNPFGMFKLDMD